MWRYDIIQCNHIVNCSVFARDSLMDKQTNHVLYAWFAKMLHRERTICSELGIQAMHFIPGPGLPSSTWPPSLSFRPCTLYERDLTNKDHVYQALQDHQAWASGHVLYTRETWPTRTGSTKLYITTKLELQAMYFIPERPDQQGPGLPSSTWPPSLSFRPCTLYERDLTNKDHVYQALHDHQAWASGHVLYTRETWPTRTGSTKLYITTKLELQALYFIPERSDQQGPGLPSSTWPPSLSFRPCTLYERDLTNKDHVYQALHDHQGWASGHVLYTRETWPTRTMSTKLYMTTKLELQAMYFIPERPDQQGPGLPSST